MLLYFSNNPLTKIVICRTKHKLMIQKPFNFSYNVLKEVKLSILSYLMTIVYTFVFVTVNW